MSAGSMHADEPETDDALVRRLITAQFPHWSGLRVERVGAAGTANAMYRLGADLVVRLPRTAGSADDTAKEQHWLPRLASSLPVAIPAPLGAGVPGEGYPHPWSVYGWLDGSCPAVGDTAEAVPLARDLARFVTALHRVDPTGGPPSYRSEPLAARDRAVRKALADLTTEIDTAAAAEIWQTALRVPAPAGPPVWIHADLQPGNMLTADGRLTAVIDFGCLGLGDAAVDLIAAWYVLPAAARDTFRTAVEADDAAWARGIGWALSIALMELQYYRETNAFMADTARHVIAEILADQRQRA
ncbi:aminoglycoside phosphotransferase family protein [Streptomyces sp. P01-B04]|uniref:aminoglycoside phosphotransferase family protein n=1 Tax=Streptomyces poriferorum TaxID=2798799 RepID=UPI001C5F3D04|nr:aminoglycoside phosphotransferase family protein [Streptomyces poriferorum]MBW5247518.1 aminoglycoside phosphotransferase family protein [Streptomyces poriferorum]MBW5255406.1 aminoglycoside phosphotransferase family protein [Streptomyces poriferorum]